MPRLVHTRDLRGTTTQEKAENLVVRWRALSYHFIGLRNDEKKPHLWPYGDEKNSHNGDQLYNLDHDSTVVIVREFLNYFADRNVNIYIAD